MAVWVGPELDSDGQPTTLHVTYAAGYHVSEAEAMWLRDLIAEAALRVSPVPHPGGEP